MKSIIGTGVALVTPFKNDLTIDFDALTKLVEHNIQNGTDYLVISGTTGESATITPDEKKQITNHVIKVNNKRLPLVLGIGGNNTQSVINELQTTDLNNIDAILSVSPYYTKPTQEGIYQHFKAIAQASPKPIILYNVPGRTSSNLLPQTTVRLATEFNNIVAIKEACNNMSQYYELLRIKPKEFLVISGDDDLVLGTVLAGGAGVISVIGQALPKAFSKMIKLGLQGNSKEAFNIHFKLMPLTALIFSENNPAGIKGLLNELNICNASVRLPLVKASDDLVQKLKVELSVFNKSY